MMDDLDRFASVFCYMMVELSQVWVLLWWGGRPEFCLYESTGWNGGGFVINQFKILKNQSSIGGSVK